MSHLVFADRSPPSHKIQKNNSAILNTVMNIHFGKSDNLRMRVHVQTIVPHALVMDDNDGRLGEYQIADECGFYFNPLCIGSGQGRRPLTRIKRPRCTLEISPISTPPESVEST